MKPLDQISYNVTYYLRFTNKNPKIIKSYYAYKYIQRRRRYLKNLHLQLKAHDYGFSYYPEQGIKKKTFMPYNLKSVPTYYYKLISIISEYFSCRAIWVKRFPKQTIDPINTFILVGYLPDLYMCHKLISFEINNIQQLYFNKVNKHVKEVIKKHKKRKINKSSNARTIASKYIKKLIHNISRIWERLLENRKKPYYHELKVENIYGFCRENSLISFGKRQWVNKPNISNAFCRENKFIKNKIIIYRGLPKVYT